MAINKRLFSLGLALFVTLYHVQVEAAVIISRAGAGARVIKQDTGNVTNYRVTNRANQDNWFTLPNKWSPEGPAQIPVPPQGYNWDGTSYTKAQNGRLLWNSAVKHKSPTAFSPIDLILSNPITKSSAFAALWAVTKGLSTPLLVGSALYAAWQELGYKVVCETNPTTGAVSCRIVEEAYNGECRLVIAAPVVPVDIRTAPTCAQAAVDIKTYVDQVYKVQQNHPAYQNYTVNGCQQTYPTTTGLCSTTYAYGTNLVEIQWTGTGVVDQEVSEENAKNKFENHQFSDLTKAVEALTDAINNKGKQVELQPKPNGEVEPTVTGSPTGEPQTTTTNKPDGGTQTQTIQDKYTYNDNKVTHTTTTTINNYDNTTNTTTTTVINNNNPKPDKEDPKDPCDSKTERIGCLDIDTPELETPKKTEPMSFQEESTFAIMGQCPPPIVGNVRGVSMTIFDYTPYCNAMLWIRYAVIASAAFIAAMMITKGLKS